MTPRSLLGIRCILGAVWLYNGTYLKLFLVDPEHLAVVEAVGNIGPLTPVNFLMLIGLAETLLGIVILSGWKYRLSCGVQFLVILAMNIIGIVSGGVEKPLALIITNLPLLALIWVAGASGPGSLSESAVTTE